VSALIVIATRMMTTIMEKRDRITSGLQTLPEHVRRSRAVKLCCRTQQTFAPSTRQPLVKDSECAGKPERWLVPD
jgi:hypothetical protein